MTSPGGLEPPAVRFEQPNQFPHLHFPYNNARAAGMVSVAASRRPYTQFPFLTGIRISVDCLPGWASSPDQTSIADPAGA